MTITEVKERPILFSTSMVQAILEGRKTVTRRVVKIPKHCYERNAAPNKSKRSLLCNLLNDVGYEEVRPPYGKPGDILWVRETWAKSYNAECSDAAGLGPIVGPYYDYKADHPERSHGWKPSIHMPRAACRLRLEIQSITVERLHDITEEDAFKEGIDAENEDYCAAEHYQLGGSPIEGGSPARFAFIALWSRINGAESWAANPWVWRIEFKKL